MTGFRDNVALGEIGKIKKNPAVVMRITSMAIPRALRTFTGAASRSPISMASAGSRPITIPPS